MSMTEANPIPAPPIIPPPKVIAAKSRRRRPTLPVDRVSSSATAGKPSDVGAPRAATYDGRVPERIMFVHLKTGYDTDAGPSWISRVQFSRTWRTAYFHGKTLHRFQGIDSNFYDHATGEWYWLSGPKRDRTDTRYGSQAPTIDDDAREAYAAFLDGALLPGREHG